MARQSLNFTSQSANQDQFATFQTSTIAPSAEMTLEFAVRPGTVTTPGATNRFFGYLGRNADVFQFVASNATGGVALEAQGSLVFQTAALTDWATVSCVRRAVGGGAVDWDLYVNGAFVITAPNTDARAFSLSGLGVMPNITFRNNFRIDEIRLFNVARTAQEIAAWHNRYIDGANPPTGLVDLISFDDDTGTVITNKIAGRPNGQLGDGTDPATMPAFDAVNLPPFATFNVTGINNGAAFSDDQQTFPIVGQGLTAVTSITLGGEAQTIATNTDTQLIVNYSHTSYAWGLQPLVIVAGANSITEMVMVTPKLGTALVTVGPELEPNTARRLTANPDYQTGWVVNYETNSGAVTVNPDLTVEAAAATVTFGVRIFDGTVIEPAIDEPAIQNTLTLGAPVAPTIINQIASPQSAVVSNQYGLDLSLHIAGATTYESVDALGDPLALPTGLSLVGSSITGILATEGDTSEIRIRGTNATGSVTLDPFIIRVGQQAVPPVFLSSPPLQAPVGQVYTYTVQIAQSQEQPATFEALTTLPAWLSINAFGLTGTPAITDLTSGVTITLRSMNPQGDTELQTFSLEVLELNVAPFFTVQPELMSATENSAQVRFTASEDVQARTVILRRSDPQPTDTEVLNGTGSGGSTPVGASALESVTGGVVTTQDITGLIEEITIEPLTAYTALTDGSLRVISAPLLFNKPATVDSQVRLQLRDPRTGSLVANTAVTVTVRASPHDSTLRFGPVNLMTNANGEVTVASPLMGDAGTQASIIITRQDASNQPAGAYFLELEPIS